MPSQEIQLRRLVIKAFHVNDVSWGDENKVGVDGKMTLNKDFLKELLPRYPFINKIDIQIIKPGDHDRWTNTVMDVIPISTKVLGEIGEGITHTLTGVYVMMTGIDTVGKQTHEFGSSEGNMKDKIFFNRAGTPGDDDFIISFDITFEEKQGQERAGTTSGHEACDEFIQIFRQQMKKFHGDDCTERHTYYDKIRPGKKRVVILKQTAGQGAMYDTHLFGHEPSGALGSRSVIDMGNMPILVSPNEYRDGIIRSMQ